VKIARKLSEGIASWLHFEFQCGRANLFNEKYLSNPIGQILTSIYGAKVVAEVNHPVLTEHMMGRGKRPKIDFAVIKDYPEIFVAVETKWIGKSAVKVDDIIWDLIRLELISDKNGADAYFILGGQQKKLQALFTSEAFLAPQQNRSPRPVLKTGEYQSMGLRLDNPPTSRIETIRSLLNKYPSVEMPAGISTGKPCIYPKQCNQNTYQVYVWKVAARKNRESFLAKEHKYYSPNA
jgi:hypothetical protein